MRYADLGVCAVELAAAEGFPVRGRFGARSRSIVGAKRRDRAPKRTEVGKPQARDVLRRRLLTPEALATVLSKPGLTIIDQRDAPTRNRGELPGALPASEALIAQLVRRRRENPPVLVYCYHGNQSRDLYAFLAQLGLRQVFTLAGGWDALQRTKSLRAQCFGPGDTERPINEATDRA